MLDLKMDTKELEALLNRIGNNEELVQKIGNAIADDLVLPALAKYPPQSGKKMQWASAKQRAYVIWAIKQGIIQVPYRRSGAYGRSFTKQPFTGGLALVSGLGYAPYVRGQEQAAYHKGNWTDLDTLALELEPQAGQIAEATIVKEIGGP